MTHLLIIRKLIKKLALKYYFYSNSQMSVINNSSYIRDLYILVEMTSSSDPQKAVFIDRIVFLVLFVPDQTIIRTEISQIIFNILRHPSSSLHPKFGNQNWSKFRWDSRKLITIKINLNTPGVLLY